MSQAALSDHIPDLDLITWYAEHDRSFLSRISPWTKLTTLVILVVLLTIARSVVLLICLYGIVLAAYVYAGLPVKKLVSWYALPFFFVISLIGILMWGEPGIPLISAGTPPLMLTLTDRGLLLFVTLVLKALISVTYTLLFLMTTRYHHLSAMAYRIFPTPLDQIFLMSYRFLFLALAMTGALLKSVRARGGGLIRSIRVQGRIFAGVFALVFIRSFDRAERISKAMQARGFSGRYVALTPVPDVRGREYLFLILSAAGVLLTILTGGRMG
jgi:cobalt/nickel transport system permease protein